jgi:hypothetical protein
MVELRRHDRLLSESGVSGIGSNRRVDQRGAWERPEEILLPIPVYTNQSQILGRLRGGDEGGLAPRQFKLADHTTSETRWRRRGEEEND